MTNWKKNIAQLFNIKEEEVIDFHIEKIDELPYAHVHAVIKIGITGWDTKYGIFHISRVYGEIK